MAIRANYFTIFISATPFARLQLNAASEVPATNEVNLTSFEKVAALGKGCKYLNIIC